MRLAQLSLYILIIPFSVLSCSSKPDNADKIPETNISIDKKVKEKEALLATENKLIDLGDSLVLPTFEIDVILSDSAKKVFAANNESIVARVYLQGIPKDSIGIEVTDLGELILGTSLVEFKNQKATFEDLTIPKSAYNSLKDKDFEILINITSGRRTSNVNLLDAEILQGSMSQICGKRYFLKAKMIGE